MKKFLSIAALIFAAGQIQIKAQAAIAPKAEMRYVYAGQSFSRLQPVKQITGKSSSSGYLATPTLTKPQNNQGLSVVSPMPVKETALVASTR
jgi:hypothetical protein